MTIAKIVVASLILSFSTHSVFADQTLLAQAGGNLVCYSGKGGSGKVTNRSMNSAHNCCTKGGEVVDLSILQ